MSSYSEETEAFLNKFGTIFNEFNSDEISSWLYYPLYLCKRFSIFSLVFFISDPVVQLILSIISSLLVRFI